MLAVAVIALALMPFTLMVALPSVPVVNQLLPQDPAGKTEQEETFADDPLPAPASAPELLVTTAPSNTITIPKIEAYGPIVNATTTNEDTLHGLLDSGAVLFPGSAIFGQPGQTVLLGHSAPAGWPDIKHDTLFSRLIELAAGDRITIDYNGREYHYSVTGTQIIDKGKNVSASETENTLALVSCWPPGRNLNRIAVLALYVDSK